MACEPTLHPPATSEVSRVELRLGDKDGALNPSRHDGNDGALHGFQIGRC